MTKSNKMNCLPRLLEKITNTNTPNNSEFTYYGYKVLMLSGTVDYTDVSIRDRHNKIVIEFTLDFLTLECEIENYINYDTRDSLVKTLKELYDGRMRFNDQQLNDELDTVEPMLGDEEYDQELVQKEYDELLTHKII